MAEVFQWIGACFHVVVAVIFALTPGMVFWLVVIGAIAIVHRRRHASLDSGNQK